MDRHGPLNFQRSAIRIQQAIRNWRNRKNQISTEESSLERHDWGIAELIRASITDGEMDIIDKIKEESEVQIVAEECPILNEDVVVNKAFCNKHLAATKIQSYVRGGLLRRQFLSLRMATIIIQRNIRMLRCRREYEHYKNVVTSAIVIQSLVRGWIARRECHRHRRLVIIVQVRIFWTSNGFDIPTYSF